MKQRYSIFSVSTFNKKIITTIIIIIIITTTIGRNDKQNKTTVNVCFSNITPAWIVGVDELLLAVVVPGGHAPDGRVDFHDVVGGSEVLEEVQGNVEVVCCEYSVKCLLQ